MNRFHELFIENRDCKITDFPHCRLHYWCLVCLLINWFHGNLQIVFLSVLALNKSKILETSYNWWSWNLFTKCVCKIPMKDQDSSDVFTICWTPTGNFRFVYIFNQLFVYPEFSIFVAPQSVMRLPEPW